MAYKKPSLVANSSERSLQEISLGPLSAVAMLFNRQRLFLGSVLMRARGGLRRPRLMKYLPLTLQVSAIFSPHVRISGKKKLIVYQTAGQIYRPPNLRHRRPLSRVC